MLMKKTRQTMDSAEERVLSAWMAPAIRVVASAIVARLRGSRHDRNKATVPMVQSQHSASGSVSSHAFNAGKYANVRCLEEISQFINQFGYGTRTPSVSNYNP